MSYVVCGARCVANYRYKHSSGEYKEQSIGFVTLGIQYNERALFAAFSIQYNDKQNIGFTALGIQYNERTNIVFL